MSLRCLDVDVCVLIVCVLNDYFSSNRRNNGDMTKDLGIQWYFTERERRNQEEKVRLNIRSCFV